MILSGLKPYLIGGVGIVAAMLIAFAGFQYLRAERIQNQFDAYKVQARQEIVDEQDRRGKEIDDATVLLWMQLNAAERDLAEAESAVEAYAREIASRPPVPGRGATEEDVHALNR